MNFLFVAGFDFGTSYSKVVLRDQFSGVAKVVTFGEQRDGLFPSYLRVAQEKIGGPGGLEKDGLLLSYPKLITADAASGEKNFAGLYGDKLPETLKLLGVKDFKTASELLLIRYFLSVLDSIHDFIGADEEWQSFDSDRDPLVVQLAVPTGLMSDRDKSVDELMQESLAAATVICRKGRTPTHCSTVRELSAGIDQLRALSASAREALNTRCITYPEVAAGVQTVLRSKNTPDGKYITLDVGAGTVDINAFHRRSRGRHSQAQDSPSLDYWACEVAPLGFARLELRKDDTRKRSSHETSVNPLKEADLLRQLGLAVNRLMGNAFRFQPYASQGDGPSPWLGETYAYAWGGGSSHIPYLDQFLASLKNCKLGVEVVSLLPSPGDHFPLPADLMGNFGRLAVAYGLSYHHANLDAIRLPDQLIPYRKKYPGLLRDEPETERLCSCRGNPMCPKCFGGGFFRSTDTLLPNLGALRLPSAERSKSKKRKKGDVTESKPRLQKIVTKKDRIISRCLNHNLPLGDQVEAWNELMRLSSKSGFKGWEEVNQLFSKCSSKAFGIVKIEKDGVLIKRYGCRVNVRQASGVLRKFSIIHPSPPDLFNLLNNKSQSGSISLRCSIIRDEAGNFFLSAAKAIN